MIKVAPFVAMLLLGCAKGSPTVVGSSILHDTYDANGPYHVATLVRGQSETPHVTVIYKLGDGNLTGVALDRVLGDASEGVYAGSFPGPGMVTQVRYFFVARVDDGGTTNDPPLQDDGSPSFYGFQVLAAQAPPGSECTSDVDCSAASRCESGTCVDHTRNCTADADCLTTETCDPELKVCAPR